MAVGGIGGRSLSWCRCGRGLVEAVSVLLFIVSVDVQVGHGRCGDGIVDGDSARHGADGQGRMQSSLGGDL